MGTLLRRKHFIILALSPAGPAAMTPDVREGVCFVVATSALSLPRHDGDPAPVDGDGRAAPRWISRRSAASRSFPPIMRAYTSIVMLDTSWPSLPCTLFGSMPLPIRKVACVCLSSWKS